MTDQPDNPPAPQGLTPWLFSEGEPPPLWLLAEVSTALEQMAKNKEVVHLFDIGADSGWSIVIGLARRTSANALASVIATAMGAQPIDAIPPENRSQTPGSDMAQRDFGKDFCAPAIKGLSAGNARRVAIALDAAIAFGALEAQEGNASLLRGPQLIAKYWDSVMRLKRL